jgi:exodeoxyribonuclease-5
LFLIISSGKFKKESLMHYLYLKKLLQTMINSYLEQIILQHFPYNPTDDQLAALQAFSVFFLSDRAPDTLLLLKGYAGTGKTSLVAAWVKALAGLQQKTVLLAPTGRAAKVFSLYAGHKAFTIHKKIYRQKSFANEAAGFAPAENLHKDTLFIVDEASMIANQTGDAYLFGSGRLLDDLIHYIYTGENCRLILLGDEAQLPPVMQAESPALNPEILRGYNLQVQEIRLTQVVRQSRDSGILFNATRLREALRMKTTGVFPKLRLQGVDDLRKIRGDELLEEITAAYARDGIEETMIVVRSNKQANVYNNGIRNRILYREEELSTGDRLMIARNNYYWTADNREMDFIANGEIMEVLRVRKITELYGFRFADLSVRFPDYELETDVKILLDTLQSEAPALPRELSDKLFYAVLEDYAHIATKAGRMKQMKSNPYYNVVQVKYAYAVTCHKAQGGQWTNVFLDVGYIREEMLGDEFYRWLYTAITRATGRLYLVNMPDAFAAKDE